MLVLKLPDHTTAPLHLTFSWNSAHLRWCPLFSPIPFVTEIYMYCISFSMLHTCLEEELISR
jgi:hypothetical protein